MAKTIKKHGKSVLLLGLLITGVLWYAATLQMPGQAEAILSETDALSDSRPTTTANHLIYFRPQNGVDTPADTITLDFDDSFSFANLVFGDIDFATSTATSNCPGATYAEVTIAAAAASNVWGWTTTTGRVMTFAPETNAIGDTLTTSTCVRIKIGKNATGGASNNQITNGWPGVKDIDFAGGFGGTGKMKVAIIEGVTVTASITESLNVTIYASSTCLVTGSAVTVGSTTTTIPYGSVNAEDFYDACQEIAIGTNAGSGYVATLHKTQPLTAGSNIISDGNCEGACTTTTEAVWDTDTFNGFGYCMKDRTLAGATVADSGWVLNPCGAAVTDQYFKVIGNNSTDAQNIMKSNTATSTNYAYIGYRLSVDSAQAAGDYTTTLIYIVTPTY